MTMVVSPDGPVAPAGPGGPGGPCGPGTASTRGRSTTVSFSTVRVTHALSMRKLKTTASNFQTFITDLLSGQRRVQDSKRYAEFRGHIEPAPRATRVGNYA